MRRCPSLVLWSQQRSCEMVLTNVRCTWLTAQVRFFALRRWTWFTTCQQAQTHEISQRGGSHLLHDSGAVILDSTVAGGQNTCDLLTGSPRDYQLQHAGFAYRQHAQPTQDFPPLQVFLSLISISLYRLAHTQDKIVAVERLLDEIDSTFAHCGDGDRNIG